MASAGYDGKWRGVMGMGRWGGCDEVMRDRRAYGAAYFIVDLG